MSIWDFKATLYKYFRMHFIFRFILENEYLRLKKLLSQLPPGKKRVLDIGTGMGNALFFVSNDHLLLGLDRSFKMLQLARKRIEASFIQADANRLPLKSKTFDLILGIGIMEYLSHLDKFFHEICRIINLGGFLVVTFSPPNLLTYLRTLLGHRIYPLRFGQFKELAEDHGFQILNRTRSLMQEQYLLKFS